MNDFICLCPFHGNTNTPSFSVSKTTGQYLCFNPACGEFGGLIDLIKRTMHKNDFEAARIINKAKTDTVESFESQFLKIVTPEELPEFSNDVITRMYKQFWESQRAMDYMHRRGFNDDILHKYKIGYSKTKDLIAVPMHSEYGKPVGVVGRTIEGKRFRNSDKLPVRDTLWNLHRAKRYGDTVILCEASFDAMLIDQAGYPNVVACLGGNFNKFHATQIKKYFNKVILFVDWDNTDEHRYDKNGKMCVKCKRDGFSACRGHNPGRDLGNKAVELLRGKPVEWASYDYRMVYPHGAKDAGDLTLKEIKQCIANAVSNLEYQQWGLYYQRDVV
jgi:DNA primase